MKHLIQSLFFLFVSSLTVISCNNSATSNESHGHAHSEHSDFVTLNSAQFKALGVKIGMLEPRNLGAYVNVNGRLEVPPQNEASITAIIGANITSIKVIEGDKISKGQVLAYLSHPDLIKVQTNYVNSWSQLEFIENDYNRQKQLYDEKVSSGREFQKVKANYLTIKGEVKGLESQLKLMGLNIINIQDGEIYENVPVVSPIEGSIRKVNVKTGQYVQPQTEMFEVVNIDHVHADFMVFEKDINLVKEGQKVMFTVSTNPGRVMYATIHSVGKAFESDPKAIHLHAEIDNKEGYLIPGMYIKGKILVQDERSLALPEEAVVMQDDKYYIFSVEDGDHAGEWNFTPLEIKVGVQDADWIEIIPLKTIKDTERFALNSAYTLMAELKKEEAEHSH